MCVNTKIVYTQVNETQGKIKEATRKMMALVSELSMTQAQAMTLQQQVSAGDKAGERKKCQGF